MFNAQQQTEHQVSSKNGKAAAKRREAELYAMRQREEQAAKQGFAPAEPKREEVGFLPAEVKNSVFGQIVEE